MEQEFIVIVSIRKGLGPVWVDKNFPALVDDIQPEMTDYEIRESAKWQVEEMLYKSEDFNTYGKNWIVKEVLST